jgi:hypothetical protein
MRKPQAGLPQTGRAMKPRYIVAVATLVGALGIGLAALFVHASAQTNINRAALIVQMKDGSVATRCVEFTEPEISGYDLLRRSGMRVIADVSNGISVCKIGAADSGCNFPAQNCFCECQDINATCIYWMYYTQVNGNWKYSALGAGSQKVKNGDVNGWVYGAGTVSGGAFPPMISYEQVCTDVMQKTAAVASSVPTSTKTAAQATSTNPPPTIAASSTPTSTVSIQAMSSVTPQPTPSAVEISTPTSAPNTVTPAAASATPLPPAPTPTPIVSTGQGSSSLGGYIIFGVIAVGLIAMLVISRRNSGKAPK